MINPFDFTVYFNKTDLDGTGYIEIGPGQYQDKHWNEGFIFIEEDAFLFVEGIITNRDGTFDHFGINNIKSEIGNKIIEDLNNAVIMIPEASLDEFIKILRLPESLYKDNESVINENKDKIIKMIQEISQFCNNCFDNNEWLCILGV